MSEQASSSYNVLFVCLGNICRSPMAEGALRSAAENAGLNVGIDSAGTASYHIGETPDPRAIATAARHGVDIEGLRGRQIGRDDFYHFTHIFALDGSNLANVKAIAPPDGTARIALLMDLVAGREGTAVNDPYYGDESGFEVVWEEVTEAAKALIKDLSR